MYQVRIKKNYELENRLGQLMVVYNGKPTGAFFDSVTLPETVEVLWNLLKEGQATKTEMLETLINKFDISTVLALGDIDVFVRVLKENDIIEE